MAEIFISYAREEHAEAIHRDGVSDKTGVSAWNLLLRSALLIGALFLSNCASTSKPNTFPDNLHQSPEPPDQTEADDCDSDIATSDCMLAALNFLKTFPKSGEARDRLVANLENCELGDASACGAAGVYIQYGWGAPRSPETALMLYHRACYAGAYDACFKSGLLLSASRDPGLQLPPPSKAMDYFEHGCEGLEAESCEALGRAYRYGVLTEKDPKSAAYYSRKACELSPAADIGCTQFLTVMKENVGQQFSQSEVAAAHTYICAKNSRSFACRFNGPDKD